MKKIIIYIFASLFFASSSISGITFWTTEVQPARMAKQQDMAKDFESKTGISVEVIPVEEKDLGKRATAAAAAGDLPDVIYHTLQYVLPWAEAGILDVNANNDDFVFKFNRSSELAEPICLISISSKSNGGQYVHNSEHYHR